MLQLDSQEGSLIENEDAYVNEEHKSESKVHITAYLTAIKDIIGILNVFIAWYSKIYAYEKRQRHIKDNLNTILSLKETQKPHI